MIPLQEFLSPHQYYFNPYAIPPAIIATLVWTLGLMIFDLSKKSNLNRPFLYFCLSAAVWLYGNAFLISSLSEGVAVVWAHIFYAGFIMIPVTIFHISIIYANWFKRQKLVLLAAYLTGSILIALTCKECCFNGVKNFFWGFYPVAGFTQSVVFAFMLFFPLWGIFHLLAFYRQSADLSERKRTKYLIIAFCCAIFSYVDILASYGIEFYPFGYLAILLFVLIMTYSIVKYNNFLVERRAEELEVRIREKSAEASRILEELRSTQIKLYETGKISALASLSAGILHQISQPVTAIHGFIKFIKNEMKDTDPFYKGISLVEEQSVYLKDMLQDLMELIRHREIKKENVNVNDCLKRATTLLTDELRIRRVEWETKMSEDLPFVYADPVHLQQIFMNIVVNAMEALISMPKGSRRYLKVITQFDAAKNNVQVFFEDTGPGITADVKHQIFEPFFSTKAKGSGIGLALCKDLIAEHGGRIDVESNSGGGAVFIVTLPAVKATLSKN